MGVKPAVNNNNVIKYESSSSVRTCLLFILLMHHIYALANIYRASKTEVDDELKKNLTVHKDMGFRFLTIWNFLGQIVYFMTELSLLFIPYQKLTPVIKDFSWMYFTTILWPTSILITTIFWGIYSVNREWILPKHAEIFLPLHLNHCVHTFILLVHLVEFFGTRRLSMPNLQLMRGLNFAYMLIYALTLNGTFLFDNVWIYPFFEWLTWPQRFVVYILTFLFAQFLMHLGYVIMSYKCRGNSKKIKHQ